MKLTYLARSSALLTLGLLAWHPAGALAAEALAQTPARAGDGRCAALTGLSGFVASEPSARIVTASLVAAAPAGAEQRARLLPAHCLVEGVLRERTGTDGQHYAVKFRLRLPLEWSGRFLFQGGGGTNGVVGSAIGPAAENVPSAIERGFAVVTTDTGHDNVANNDPAHGGVMAFGRDPQAREELAETALDSVATVAKVTITKFYGRPAEHSYFVGCSNGGREGLIFAERFPDQFDGISSAAPAMAVPRTAIALAWQVGELARMAKREGWLTPEGVPDLTRTYSVADTALAAGAINAACDSFDGLKDGLIQNYAACTTARVRPELNRIQCAGAKTATCLTAPQIALLIRLFEGPRDGAGRQVYPAYPWDSGIALPNWYAWHIAMGPAPSINLGLVVPGLAWVFTTPPDPVEPTPQAAIQYAMDLNVDRARAGIERSDATFKRSGWAQLNATSADLDRFRARGGKLLVPHGTGDPVFSIFDTLNWWNRVDSRYHGKASDFARVFAVPGADHCFLGGSVDQFDGLGALMGWVEQGKVPERIIATGGHASPWPHRQRPLCVYPGVAHYKGGDPEAADSFVCQAEPKDVASAADTSAPKPSGRS